MPRVAAIQTNFTSGELSPRMEGRVDLSKYFNGASSIENFIVQTHGGVLRAPGTHFSAEVKDSAKKTRLGEFEFSNEQAYVLEFGDQYLRFYMNRGQIVSAGAPYEIATPYLEADLFDLHLLQSNDVIYITHHNYAPRMLSRTGHTAWALTEIVFLDGPYLVQNTTATTLAPSATTGTITLTASTNLFDDPGHIGSFWRILHGATWGYAKITAITDAQHATATVITAFGGIGAVTTWREGAWSSYRGFPRTAAFYEDRLFFAASEHQPLSLWGSKSGDYYNHTPGTTDEDPLNLSLNSKNSNGIRWLAEGKVLLIGTMGGEFVLSPSSLNEALTPTNLKATRHAANGSQTVQPLEIENLVVYLQRHGRKIRELFYNFQDDGYVSSNLTLLANHITIGGVVQMAHVKEPDSVILAVRNDGQLLGATYERQQQVIAWWRRTTDGIIESVAAIPGPNRDEVWLVVNRTIGGATRRYVEWMEFIPPEEVTNQSDMFYVDSGLTYEGAPATIISGLSHLAGKTVAVLADGAVRPNVVVSAGGQITLDREARKVQVGLPYESRLQTVRLEGGAAEGTSQGKSKRVHGLTLRLQNASGVYVGPDDSNLEEVILQTTDIVMGTPPILFSGDKYIDYKGGWEIDARVVIKAIHPMPAGILSIITRVTTIDG